MLARSSPPPSNAALSFRRRTRRPTCATPSLAPSSCSTVAKRASPRSVDDGWHVNEWLKKAVLLSFRLNDNRPIDAGYTQFYDKVPLKYSGYDEARLRAEGVRIVPHAIVRRGAFVAANAILMPSYVNIGAYVGEGTMVDTWATVGSCAQIGRNVHLSGGVGIGGVLEPLQASPTIIEDNCFIGARSEVVEGVVVEEGAVISMGVFIGASTRIYDRETRCGATRPCAGRQRGRGQARCLPLTASAASTVLSSSSE